MSGLARIESAQLTLTEGAKLAELEEVVERGFRTFIDVGNALGEIQAERLYRETHTTFDDYCRERWGFSRQYAYRVIDEASVNQLVDTTNRAQAQALAPLARQAAPEVVREVYAEAVAEAGAPEKVTAAQLREKVAEVLPSKRQREPGQLETAARKKVWTKVIDLREACDEIPGLNIDRATAAASDEDIAGWLRITDGAITTLSAFRRRLEPS